MSFYYRLFFSICNKHSRFIGSANGEKSKKFEGHLLRWLIFFYKYSSCVWTLHFWNIPGPDHQNQLMVSLFENLGTCKKCVLQNFINVLWIRRGYGCIS